MTDAVRKSRAVLIELYHRVVKLSTDKKDDAVYWNGENNLYPNEVERVVNSSPTAKRSAKIMAKFISGRGLTDESQDVIVNVDKNYKLSKVADLVAQDIAEQGGSWIHRGFGFELNETTGEVKIVPKTLDVLDYCKIRKSKEDDNKDDSKIWLKDYTEKSMFGKKDKDQKWFYPLNNNQDVIISQIKADYKDKKGEPTDNIADMLPYYRGQVYYWNTTPKFKYALAPIDSVYNAADSEARIQTWENGEIRKGFLGKTAVLTQGLDDEIAKNIDKQIEEWLGESSNGIFRLDLESVEDITKVLHVIQLKAQIDPKLFSDMKKQLATTIMGAFNSIPELLVVSSSGSLFGTSGETYEQAKIFYNEQTESERWGLSETLTYMGFPCEIKPIVEPKIEITPSI